MSSLLSTNKYVLLLQPTLALSIGFNEAIFLQQVHYWLTRPSLKKLIKGRHWIYNTYKQWKKQFPFWSEKTIQRTVENLEDMKVLISYSGMVNNKKTKLYSIDYDILNFLTGKNTFSDPSGQNDHINLPKRADVENLRSSDMPKSKKWQKFGIWSK